MVGEARRAELGWELLAEHREFIAAETRERVA